MAREKSLKRTLEGICKTTDAIEHQSECEDENTRNTNSSDDRSTPFEDDPLTGSVKKPVAVPSTMFEYIGPVKGTEMSHFKCLLGCSPTFNTNGTPKYISCSNHSRFNIRRHVKTKHKTKLNQFDNEAKNLNNGERTSKRRSKSPASLQLKDNPNKNVSGRTVSCQTEFGDQGSNDVSINSTPLTIKDNRPAKTIAGFKKPVMVPSTMFQYIGPVKGTEMSLFKCLLGCLPLYNSNGTQKYISCANNSRYNLRRHVKLKHKSKLLQFNERSRMLASTLKEELDKESESALFQLKQLLDQEENASNDRSNEDLPREKSIVAMEDSETFATSVDIVPVENASDNNLSVIDGSSIPFVDVSDFLQMTLDVQPSLAKEKDVLRSCTSQHETRSASQGDSASENQSISSNAVRRMYSSSKEKSSGAVANNDSSGVPRLSRQSSVSTPEDQNTLNSCPEDKQTSSIDIDYMHFPCAITVNQVPQDDADETDSLLQTPTTLFHRSSRSSQTITKQITQKELSKTVEGRSIKEGAGIGPPPKHVLPVLPLKELKLSPNQSTAFQDQFGNHVYWLQLIRRPKLVGNAVLWNDVYQEIQSSRIDGVIPNKCEIKFRTSLYGNVITKYYKPIKLSQNANDVIDNYPFAAWTPLITVSTETIHVLKLARITGIDDPMLKLIPELIFS